MKAVRHHPAAPGRDYVIDVSSPYLDRFCEAAKNLNLSEAFREVDLAMAVFFVVRCGFQFAEGGGLGREDAESRHLRAGAQHGRGQRACPPVSTA